MMIPLVKVGLPERHLLMPQLEDVLYSGMISEGEFVYSFEEEFKKSFEIANGIAFSSGTAALHTALILAGISNGDEVITTSMTAEPTNTSILQAGGIPVFADVDVESGNISPESIVAKITDKTKAIVVVHYAGYPVVLNKIRAIADSYNLKLIEDCAHALGSRYENIAIGNTGDFSIFSFQAIKHMTTVDGGFLAFRCSSYLDMAKKIRWFGMTKGISRTEVNITDLGYKYNMTNVAAVIGLKQLEIIKNRIQTHIYNGNFYNDLIDNISGLERAKFDVVSQPSYWLYTVLTDDSDDLIKKCMENGISASKLHRPNHFHSIFSKNHNYLPNLEVFYKKLVHIPCGWWVGDEEREHIKGIIKGG